MAFNSLEIIYHKGNCLNNKKASAKECRICHDKCPHKAISGTYEIDAKKCTECGLCIALCPSDGFVDRGMDALYEYLTHTEVIVLNCPMANPLGFEIPCLGLFDRDLWTTFMLMAEKKQVNIHTGDCKECDDREACASSVSTFKKIYDVWAKPPLIHIRVNPDTGENKPVQPELQAENASTEATGSWRKRNRTKLERYLPSLTADETNPVPRTREWLAEALRAYPEDKIPFKSLEVSDSCINCGVCSAICPQGALQKREIEGKFRLIYEPFKCVHCERCIDACRQDALKIEIKYLSSKLMDGRILIHEGIPVYCERCGKQLFEKINPPLCPACSSTDPDRKNFLL